MTAEPAVDLDTLRAEMATALEHGHCNEASHIAGVLFQRLVDTTTALERADDFLQAWFEWQPEDDPSPRFGAVVQAGARLRAALAAVAPAPPTCSTCDDRGTVYVRTGAIEWEPEDCPDCRVAAALPTEPIGVDALHADPDGCPVVVGQARDAVGSILVCNHPLPCPDHPVAAAPPTLAEQIVAGQMERRAQGDKAMPAGWPVAAAPPTLPTDG